MSEVKRFKVDTYRLDNPATSRVLFVVDADDYDAKCHAAGVYFDSWKRTEEERDEAQSQLAALREDITPLIKAQLGISTTEPGESFIQESIRLYRLVKKLAGQVGMGDCEEVEDLDERIENFAEYDDIQQRLADAERRNAAVQHLSTESLDVIAGMVEHCLNVRACMGMDEGYKDYLNEEDEHDFVKEIREFVAALSQLAALREELETSKRNERNSEVAYKASIERQEELRKDLDWNRLCRSTSEGEWMDALNASEQRLAEAERRNSEMARLLKHFANCADVRNVGTMAMDAVSALNPKP